MLLLVAVAVAVVVTVAVALLSSYFGCVGMSDVYTECRFTVIHPAC